MTQNLTSTYQPTFLEKLLGRNYKWWFLFITSLRSDTTYFSQNVFYMFSAVIKNLLFILVWYINFLSGSTLLSLQEIVHYFIVGALVSALLYSDSNTWFLAHQIQSGKLSNLLLSPSSLFKWIFFNDLGRGVLQMSVQVSLTLGLLVIANYFLPINLSLFSLVAFGLILIFSRLILFLMGILQACAAFWFTEIWGITSIVSNFWTLSSGEMFPLHVLTGFFQVFFFTFFLPFPFLFYYPTQIYLGNYNTNQTLLVFAGGIIWCVVLYFFAKLVFKLGLKRNESVGL